jgi:uncharacterized membrane protein
LKGRRVAALSALLVVAALLRCFGLGAHGLWWDEMLSLSSACGSTVVVAEPITTGAGPFTAADFWRSDTASNVAQAVIRQDGGNGILYHLLLHEWIRAFGVGDAAVRAPSALAGVLTVWGVWALALRLFGASAAWWAGGFAAAHPLLVRYSQEARPYALATLLALLATLCLVRLWRSEDPSPGWGLLYGVAAAGAFLSHYLCLSVLLGHGVFAAFGVRSRRVWTSLLPGLGAATMLVGAWLFAAGGREGARIMAQQNESYRARAASPASGEGFALPASPRYLVAGVVQTVYGLSGNTLQNGGARITQLLPLAVVPVLLIGATWAHARRGGRTAELKLTLLLAVSGLVLAVALALASGHIISFQVNYATFASPYFTILMAAGLDGTSGRRWIDRGARVAAALQAVVVVGSLKLLYDDVPRLRGPNPYPEVAQQVAAERQVSYPSWFEARVTNLYLSPGVTTIQAVSPGETCCVRLGDGSRRLRLPQP